MARILISAASRPPFAKNARMGHPRTENGESGTNLGTSGSRALGGRRAKRQHYFEPASLPHNAAHFDAAVVFFDDTAGEREPQTRAAAFRRVERTEDVGQVLRLNTTPGVADHHTGTIVARTDLDADRAFLVQGLHVV